MNTKIAVTIIGLASLAIVGCNTSAPKGPINVNPIAPITGGFNPGTFNPSLVVEAASQCPQVGSVSVVGFGVNFQWQRNVPPGYVPQPIVPLTADRVALIENDFVASQVYAMRNNHSSDDVSISAAGVVIIIHIAYPPSTLNTTASTTVTNAVVTLPTTVTIPGGTNNVVSQVINSIK